MNGLARSTLDIGTDGTMIDVECHLSNGLPGITIVGFAQKAVDEARERVRASMATTQIPIPKKRITINLAPADVPKDTASLDLAIIIAILGASGQCKVPKSAIFIGEVSLDGNVRPVRGIIGKLLAAVKKGSTTAYIPSENTSQASLIHNLTIIPVQNIRDLLLHLSGARPLPDLKISTKRVNQSDNVTDFREIIGQQAAKRAFEIAAAGQHNLLINGPPGTGKSMLSRALPSILPELGHEDIVAVTHLHSLASAINHDTVISSPPFRSPHHSASEVSIIGGGQKPKPGEVSLAHRGVLFMDEFPEFGRAIIEALRQPLEDHTITIARAKDTLQYPADFMLIATANPCPCGYFESSKTCRCLPHEILKYQKKLSGPILDRIDLHVTVGEIDHTKLLSADANEENSNIIRGRVMAARARQASRYGHAAKLNGRLSSKEIKAHIKLAEDAKTLLDTAAARLQLSARTYMRTLKVAQTIADLADETIVSQSHIAEALQYRPRELGILDN